MAIALFITAILIVVAGLELAGIMEYRENDIRAESIIRCLNIINRLETRTTTPVGKALFKLKWYKFLNEKIPVVIVIYFVLMTSLVCFYGAYYKSYLGIFADLLIVLLAYGKLYMGATPMSKIKRRSELTVPNVFNIIENQSINGIGPIVTSTHSISSGLGDIFRVYFPTNPSQHCTLTQRQPLFLYNASNTCFALFFRASTIDFNINKNTVVLDGIVDFCLNQLSSSGIAENQHNLTQVMDNILTDLKPRYTRLLVLNNFAGDVDATLNDWVTRCIGTPQAVLTEPEQLPLVSDKPSDITTEAISDNTHAPAILTAIKEDTPVTDTNVIVPHNATIIYQDKNYDSLVAGAAKQYWFNNACNYVKEGGSLTFIPLAYGAPLPSIPSDQHVYVLGIGLNTTDEDLDILKNVKSLTWITHLAIPDNKLNAIKTAIPNAIIINDTTASSSVSAWKYFNQFSPALAEASSDRNLWQFNNPDSAAICAYANTYLTTVGFIADFCNKEPIDKSIVSYGQAILDFKQAVVEKLAKSQISNNIFYQVYKGLDIPVINVTPGFISETLESLFTVNPEITYPVVIGYEHINNKFVYHVRTTKESGVNAGVFCSAFGGGGGNNAGSFTLTMTCYNPLTVLHEQSFSKLSVKAKKEVINPKLPKAKDSIDISVTIGVDADGKFDPSTSSLITTGTGKMKTQLHAVSLTEGITKLLLTTPE